MIHTYIVLCVVTVIVLYVYIAIVHTAQVCSFYYYILQKDSDRDQSGDCTELSAHKSDVKQVSVPEVSKVFQA